MSENNQEGKLNLWSSNKKGMIDGIFKNLKALRYKGEYYEEIGLPQIDLVIRGLLQDVDTLKRENTLLKNKLKNENSI